MNDEPKTLPAMAAPRETAAGKKSVLIVDDEAALCRALERVLRAAGFDVTTTTDSTAAVDLIMNSPFDVILSDVMMPNMTGVDLLRMIRTYDLDVPVILMTGNPQIDTAMEAVALGALQYLPKPTPNDVLVQAVERASRLHRVANMKRDALGLVGEAAPPGDRAGLEAAFGRALESMWMAYQPIVDGRRVFGYEALMRTKEPTLPTPQAVITAAERLGRLDDLGRHARQLAVHGFRRAPDGAALFVNIHTHDLLDNELFAPSSPLRLIAHRVVLEVTERTAIESVKDVFARVAILRFNGFRIAIDDLGSGHAGLSSFAALEPDIVKVDMSLVRNVHESPVRERLIASICSVCKEMKVKVVAEGIEIAAEYERTRDIGCELFQGYLFARPGPPFPSVTFIAP